MRSRRRMTRLSIAFTRLEGSGYGAGGQGQIARADAQFLVFRARVDSATETSGPTAPTPFRSPSRPGSRGIAAGPISNEGDCMDSTLPQAVGMHRGRPRLPGMLWGTRLGLGNMEARRPFAAQTAPADEPLVKFCSEGAASRGMSPRPIQRTAVGTEEKVSSRVRGQRVEMPRAGIRSDTAAELDAFCSLQKLERHMLAKPRDGLRCGVQHVARSWASRGFAWTAVRADVQRGSSTT